MLSSCKCCYFDVADEPPMDPMEREQALRKAAVFGYFEPSEDYPSEELALNAYKGTSFRERSGQLKEHHKGIAERKRSSPFRERGGKHSLQSEHLKELFLNDLAEEEENQLESDAEYVELLKELWDKYKYTHAETPYKETSEDLIRMYNKDIKIRKRQVPGEYQPSGGWGPIAFKKKRSSNQRLDNGDTPNDFLYSLKFVSQSDPSAVENLKDEKVIDEEEDPDVSKMMLNREQAPRYSPFETVASPADMREEYMLALQPLNNPQSGDDIPEDENNYDYESAKEKRFPVSKRSGFSKPIFLNHQVLEKRNLRGDKKNLFRSSGTDPRVIKELSSIFGEKEYDTKEEIFKKPVVKRSQIADETSHEVNPPMVSVLSHHHYNDSHENHTHEHEHDHEHGDGHVGEDGHDHEHHDLNHPRHEHENKPPLLRGPEEGSDHSHEHEDHKEMTFKEDEKSHLTVDHPIILKKKSVDWSNYFGFDKRKKKSVNNNMDLNYLRNLYLRNAKKHLNEHSPNSIDLLEEPLEDSSNINDRPGNLFEAKRTPKQLEQIKLDSMDNKLKNMESIIVDEALQYSGTDDGLDTKEEQENKEKILSRLAAAYSLEKMRKALKEFKISLQAQRNAMKEIPPIEYDEDKEKRTSEQDKKNKSSGDSHIEDIPKSAVENAIRDKIDADFESEQGAGHFLNGPIEPMSEGYMGGSGMKNKPQHNEGKYSNTVFFLLGFLAIVSITENDAILTQYFIYRK